MRWKLIPPADGKNCHWWSCHMLHATCYTSLLVPLLWLWHHVWPKQFIEQRVYFGLTVPEGWSPWWLSRGSRQYVVGAAAGSSPNKLEVRKQRELTWNSMSPLRSQSLMPMVYFSVGNRGFKRQKQKHGGIAFKRPQPPTYQTRCACWRNMAELLKVQLTAFSSRARHTLAEGAHGQYCKPGQLLEAGEMIDPHGENDHQCYVKHTQDAYQIAFAVYAPWCYVHCRGLFPREGNFLFSVGRGYCWDQTSHIGDKGLAVGWHHSDQL